MVALIFLLSFLLSRVLLRVDAHTALLGWLSARARKPAQLCGAIMLVTLALSTVIPNLITVLAVLPVVGDAVARAELRPDERQRLITLLGLGVIYAANIGGVASMVGSPANMLLIGALHHFDVPGAESLNFGTWLLWGIPLALAFLATAWAVLILTQRRACQSDLSSLSIPAVPRDRDWTRALTLCWVTIVGAAAAGVARGLVDQGAPLGSGTFEKLDILDLGLMVLTLCWAFALFIIRLPERGEAVLRLQDLVGGLPWRGVRFALAAVALTLALEAVGVVDAAMDWLENAVPPDLDPDLVLAVAVLATIFLTELFSNTATAVAMWALMVAVAQTAGYSPLMVMLGVALASTSAFMSPLATPASGLGFGGLKGMSLRQMILSGALLNLLGAGLIIAALHLLIPWVLGS